MATIRPLIITQGNRVSGQIIPTHGPSMRIKLVDDYIVTLTEPHCFAIGERVHLMGTSDCGQLYQGVFRVAATTVITPGADPDLAFALEEIGCSSPMPDKIIDGIVGRAMILDGFSVEGSIRTRRPGFSPPGLTGCVKVGATQIKLMPEVEVSVGDRLVFPAAGLANAIVTGVYEQRRTTAGGTSSTASGGGCGCPAPAANAVPQLPGSAFVSVNLPASTSVSCDEPAPVLIEGRELAVFNSEIDSCGRINYEISSDFADYQFPLGDCSGEAIAIGCYELTLLAGSSWRAILAAGEVFLNPSMV